MSELSMKFLQSHNAFTGRPVKKTVTWISPKGTECTATTYIRPVGYQSAVGDLLATGGHRDPLASRIVAHICDESGNPVFTYEDVIGTADPKRGALDANLTLALAALIGEVINEGKTNRSAPPKNSSAS